MKKGTTGTIIQVESRAPLYDPVRLRLQGQILTLHGSEAGHIEMIYMQEEA